MNFTVKKVVWSVFLISSLSKIQIKTHYSVRLRKVIYLKLTYLLQTDLKELFFGKNQDHLTWFPAFFLLATDMTSLEGIITNNLCYIFINYILSNWKMLNDCQTINVLTLN